MNTSVYNFTGRVTYEQFVEAAENTVRAVAARSGFSGSNLHLMVQAYPQPTASITGQVQGDVMIAFVYLPACPPGQILSAEFARKSLAYLLHEALHLLYSQIDEMRLTRARGEAAQAAKGVPFSTVCAAFNICEDYYIERIGSDPALPIVGNAGALLGRLNDDLYADASALGRAANPDPVQAGLSVALLSINRHGRQETPALDALAAKVRAVASPDVLRAVDRALDALDRLADECGSDLSAHQANMPRRAVIAGRLLAALKNAKPSPQPQPGEGQEGEAKPGEGQEGEAKPGEGQEGEAKPGEGSGAGGAGADLSAVDPDKARAEAMAALMPAVTAEEAQLAASTPLNPARARSVRSGGLGHGRSGEYISLAVQAYQAINIRRLADAARRGLKSVDQVDRERRLPAGRLDRRALPRTSIGARDVFCRRQDTPGVRTAVLVMVDRSGSMGRGVDLPGGVVASRLSAVIGVAAAMMPALDRAQAENALAVFGRLDTRSNPDTPTVGFLVGWKDKTQTNPFLSAWGNSAAEGGTPMAREVRFATRELLARRVERRVCLWLCDGSPNEPNQAVARLLDHGRSQGVEHYGIGLQCDLSDVFGRRTSIEVQDFARLPDAMEAMLLGRKR